MTQVERFQDTAATLYKYAIVRLRDKQAAEDAVSETLVRFLQNPKSSSIPQRETKFWLLGILRNIIQEEFRRKNLVVEPQWDEDMPNMESQLLEVKAKPLEDEALDFRWYEVFVPSKQMSIYTSSRLRDSDAIALKGQMLQVIQTVEFK